MKQCNTEENANLAVANQSPAEVAPVKTCARCGGTKSECGHLLIPHGGEVIFRLFKTSISQRYPNISVSAEICLSCGALELSADPEKARELLK